MKPFGNIRTLLSFCCALVIAGTSSAQVTLTDDPTDKGAFQLAGTRGAATICYDRADAAVVAKSAELLSHDVAAVTGNRPEVVTELPSGAANLVVAGTIGRSRWIDALISSGKIDTKEITGAWERYGIYLVANPFKGVRKALVIAGSDRRATAYGIFSISRTIGVSPWYWWADTPVKERGTVTLAVSDFCSEEPSVKYRGIFINDEDWGLLPWAQNTFEPEAATIGPKTYAKVCELLLRLNANYLCPAMHRRSVAFNQIPENKVVADEYAIVMGSVHCEPLLYNNAREWDRKTMGEWNYQTNKQTINSVLRRRVEENGCYENVYTLALRGLHDRAMEGSRSFEDRKAILESALDDQRRILSDIIRKPIEEIPQAFTPYKEVLDIYEKGMNLPDEVTIIWPDDNFGYMKRLSNPRERERSGRSGVYYHVSYHGKPHDYLWLCTTPPQLMYEELSKVYNTGGDRVWLLNVGDIKPCEFAMDLFLAMAWDFKSFSYENVADSHARWLAGIFGDEHFAALDTIMQEYYRLSFSSKPEYMGWGFEWNTKYGKHEKVTDTDYSFANYSEAERRIADYEALGRMSQSLHDKLDGTARASYYQLVHYPVKGSEMMNKELLWAQKNRWYALQGRAATNTLRKASLAVFDSLRVITADYNSLLDGKWNHMMSLKQGVTAHYFETPKLDSITLPRSAEMAVWAEGEDVIRGVRSFCALPSFNRFRPQKYAFEIFNRGSEPFAWELTASAPWIRTDKTAGTVGDQTRINVWIDWANAPSGERIAGYVDVKGAGRTERVLVSVFNPSEPAVTALEGLFVEDNGYISIPAADFHRKVENGDITMHVIDNLGVENRSVQMGDPLAPEQNLYDRTPCLEYDFYTFSHGSVDVYTYTLPAFMLYPKEEFGNEYGGHDATNAELRYGLSIDDNFVLTPTIPSHEYSQSWSENVLKNCSIKKTTMKVDKAGKHTLRVLCGDPGVVVQKIVLDFGGLKRSYIGPRSTQVRGTE